MIAEPIRWLLAALAVALAAPSLLLLVEVLRARRVVRAGASGDDATGAHDAAGASPGIAARSARPVRIAVVIPAHDESAGIGATVDAVRAQLAPDDWLLVVADNCSDDTARIARAHGARVTERTDPQHRGKGYALDHGVRALHDGGAAPDCLIVIDADCVPAPHALARLAQSCVRLGVPVQGRYLMRMPPSAAAVPATQRVSEFAFRIKNRVRPLGLGALGGPVPLQGTGMALPWAQARALPLASGDIVEDMAMGIESTLAGHFPVFLDAAHVDSEFPQSDAGRAKQRARWEHGHMQTIRRAVPRLVRAALRTRSAGPLLAALDVAIAPLSLLVGLHAGLVLLTALAGWTAVGLLPFALACLGAAATAAAIVAAWDGFGRDLLAGRDLAALARYAASKLPLYARFATDRHREWNRAERNGDH